MAASTGVAPPPPGVTPQFDISSGRLKLANTIIVGVGLGLSTSSLVMRLYTKTRLMKKFWLDDVFIILAWLFSAATQAAILWGFSHSSYGMHIWDLTIERLTAYAKNILATSILYIPALGFSKLAMFMFYYVLLRITPAWQYTLWGIAFIIFGYSTALILALIFGCDPIKRSWDPAIPGDCINHNAIFLATAITNTVSDLILIFIPIPIVSQLHLPLVQRLGVICMFGIGSLTIITSIIRLATLMPLITSSDQPYQIALAAIFINIEANFIILCASLPYLRQFLRHYAPKFIGDSFPSKGSTPGADGDTYQTRNPGLERLQDDIQRAMTVEDLPDLAFECPDPEARRHTL